MHQCRPKLAICLQSLGHNLIHIEIPVVCEPTDKGSFRLSLRKLAITMVQICIRRIRYGIIRLTFCRRDLSHDRSGRILLSGQVLELGSARIRVLVWIVHNSSILKLFRRERLMLKLQGTIRQLPEATIKVLIDGPRVDELAMRDARSRFAEVRT